jgi:death-on-curing protein
MTAFIWIQEQVVWAIQESQLAEHGGGVGLRDAGLLASALARPVNLVAYGNPEVTDCAAAYGFGLSRNHPFIDGNKRTAFVCMELFLALNGYQLVATDIDCVQTMLAVAAGELDEPGLAGWLREHTQKVGVG